MCGCRWQTNSFEIVRTGSAACPHLRKTVDQKCLCYCTAIFTALELTPPTLRINWALPAATPAGIRTAV